MWRSPSFIARAHDLSNRSKRARIALSRAASLICVEALHKKRLIHCDIKTKHFMRFGGEWKLIDYDSVLEEGETKRPACTLKYAAPEVMNTLDGAPLSVQTSIDMWSMGIVLFELLTGTPLVQPGGGEAANVPAEGAAGENVGAAEPPSIALQPSLARQGTSYGHTQHILDACANARPELVERRLAELNQTHAGLLRHMLCTDPKGRCPDPSGRSSVTELLRKNFFQHRE